MRPFRPVLYAALLLAAGCDQTTEVVAPREAALSLAVRNLSPVDPEEGTYRLWARIYEFSKRQGGEAIRHSEVVSLGDFAVDPATGAPVDSAGQPARFLIPAGWDPQLVASVMVSFQPHHHEAGLLHDDPGPVLMAGSVTGDAVTGSASLTPAHPEAFGADFAQARGKYTVIAPTSPPDSNSGVWFVDYTTAPPAGIRDLPALPAGWVYEGWVVDLAAQPGVRFSTGRFLRPDSADLDGAGPGRGPLPGLDFPGQDFINGVPARPDLNGARYRFEITIEPAEDDHPGAFPLLLFSSIPMPVPAQSLASAGPVSRDLFNWSHSFPAASFRMTRP